MPGDVGSIRCHSCGRNSGDCLHQCCKAQGLLQSTWQDYLRDLWPRGKTAHQDSLPIEYLQGTIPLEHCFKRHPTVASAMVVPHSLQPHAALESRP